LPQAGGPLPGKQAGTVPRDGVALHEQCRTFGQRLAAADRRGRVGCMHGVKSVPQLLTGPPEARPRPLASDIYATSDVTSRACQSEGGKVSCSGSGRLNRKHTNPLIPARAPAGSPHVKGICPSCQRASCATTARIPGPQPWILVVVFPFFFHFICKHTFQNPQIRFCFESSFWRNWTPQQ
jgi:hypothetical protein